MKSALLSLIFLETETDTDSVFCAPRNVAVGLTKKLFLVVNFNFSVTDLYLFFFYIDETTTYVHSFSTIEPDCELPLNFILETTTLH